MVLRLGLVGTLLVAFGCEGGEAVPEGVDLAGGGGSQDGGGQTAGDIVGGGAAGTRANSAGGPIGSAGAATDGGRDLDAVSGGDGSGANDRYKQVACPPGPFPAPAGTNRQQVCTGFKYSHTFNEGPVWVPSEKAFFFSNFQIGDAASNFNGDIIKYTPGGQCEIFIKDVGTNGLGIAPDGNLLGASHLTRSIVEFDLVTKQPKTLLDNYMGKKLNSPNDIIVHSNGTIYFTNPDYEVGNRPMEMGTAVLRIDPAGIASMIAMGGEPNGITLSPDEKRLYVEQDGSGVKVYDLDDTGAPSSGPRDFSMQTDGMAVDCAGNVYLSGAGAIVSPDGKVIANIPGGGGTMPTFGGADGKTLLIIGGGTNVATVQMNLPGLP
jgi:gluconolactonase